MESGRIRPFARMATHHIDKRRGPSPQALEETERDRQSAMLPPGTSRRYIYRHHGWRVLLRREGSLINGGHFMQLSDAVAARDLLLEKYPSRALGRPRSRSSTTEPSS